MQQTFGKKKNFSEITCKAHIHYILSALMDHQNLLIFFCAIQRLKFCILSMAAQTQSDYHGTHFQALLLFNNCYHQVNGVQAMC